MLLCSSGVSSKSKMLRFSCNHHDDSQHRLQWMHPGESGGKNPRIHCAPGGGGGGGGGCRFITNLDCNNSPAIFVKFVESKVYAADLAGSDVQLQIFLSCNRCCLSTTANRPGAAVSVTQPDCRRSSKEGLSKLLTMQQLIVGHICIKRHYPVFSRRTVIAQA